MTTTIRKFSTDSGIIGDGLTNDNTLTLDGTATANSTVRVYDGTTLLGTATANSSGAWNFTTGTLSNGTHSFTAATTSTSSPSSGFPDASTTGVPPGTSLTTVNGNLTTSYAGQIIDARDVNGAIIVNHPGVIIRNCEATYIDVYADNCLIEDTTVTGQNAGQAGIDLLGSDNTTVRRCDISGVENGIWLEANGCLIQDNYIHDLRNDVYFDPHFDGLQIGPGSTTANNVITHNNFDLGAGANACIMIEEATNIDITYNRFYGGGYNIYFEDKAHTGRMTGCDVIGNVFVQNVYGDIAGNAVDAQYYSGNLYGEVQIIAPDPGNNNNTIDPSNTASTTTTDTSTALQVRVDTVAPNAPTIATPATNANGGLNITGTAEANSVVTVYDGTTQLGTATANGSGAWSYTSGALATGSHSLTARATDAAGNTGATSAVVTANTGTTPAPTPPAAPKISSFSNDSGTAGDGITNDNTLMLTGTAAANSTVKLFDGTTLLGTATANGSGAWSYTTAALSDGSHSLTATATTTSGTSPASSALAVKIDTTAPTAPAIATPTANANGGLNLTGTAEANSAVKIYDGTTEIGTATANASGGWTYTTGVLATGSHSLTARATDVAGNTGAASSAVTVGTNASPAPTQSRTEAPKIISFSNDSGTAGDGVTNDNTVTLTGTAAAGSAIRVYDGATQIGTTTANSSGAWSYTTAALPDGTHPLAATATTSGGGMSPASSTLVLRIDTTGSTSLPGSRTDAPKIISFSNDSGTVGDGVTNDNTVTLTGTAAAGSAIRVYDGATQIGTTTANSSGAWSFTTAALPDGNHPLAATATTSGGGMSPASSTLVLRIDTTGSTSPPASRTDAPKIISFSNDSGTVGDGVTNDNTVTLTGTAAAGSAIRVYDGATQIGTTTANSSGAWSFTTAALPDGNHPLAATATTSGGGMSPASSTLVLRIDTTALDTTAPRPEAPKIVSFSNDSGTASDGVTNDNTVTLTGTAAAGSTVKVYDGATQIGTTTANSGGAWSYSTATLSDGNHPLAATTTTAGGMSPASSTLALKIDTKAPTAPTMATPTNNGNDTLTLTGTAEANGVVKVYDGTTQIGTATANSSGAWSHTTGTLADGSHSLTARATDAAGNTGAASAVVAASIGSSSSPSGPSSGFPDASTTGVPPGTSLTTVNGNFTTSYAGQIIDAKDVNGAIIVNHPGVIIRNCEATYIDVYADNCLIEDTTVTGQNAGQAGIDLLGSDNTTVRRCDISGVENGIWLEANGCLIQDNWIHDLRNDVYFDPHFDGLQIGPGTTTANNVITHNNFDLGPGANACIMIEEATNIDISYNRFYGGGYNIYFEDKAHTGRTTGCDVIGNVFVQNVYGDIAGNAVDAQHYSGNVYGEVQIIAPDPGNNNNTIDPSNTASTTATDTSTALAAPTIATTSTASVANLVGTASNDDLQGDAGANRIEGRAGNDTLAGLDGSDIFVFAANFGKDVISDFQATGSGQDVVEFSRTVFDDFADVLAHASQQGQDVVIDAGGGNTLTLKNTSLTALDRTDFHFA